MKLTCYLTVVLLVVLSCSLGYFIKFFSEPRKAEEIRRHVGFSWENKECDVVVTRRTRQGNTWYYFELCQAGSEVPISGQAYIISTDSVALTNFSVEFRDDHVDVRFDASGLWPDGSNSRLQASVRNGAQCWTKYFNNS